MYCEELDGYRETVIPLERTSGIKQKLVYQVVIVSFVDFTLTLRVTTEDAQFGRFVNRKHLQQQREQCDEMHEKCEEGGLSAWDSCRTIRAKAMVDSALDGG